MEVNCLHTVISFDCIPFSQDFTMTYSLLSQLVSGRNDFMIRVRLCRMWDVINHRKNGKLISMEMIFIDEKVLSYIDS